MTSSGIVWITGAGSGLGRATALRYIQTGATVVGTARHMETLEEVAAAATGMGGRFHAMSADLSDGVAAADVVDRIERDIGPVGLALLNAGTHKPMPASAYSALTVRQLLDANVMTVAHCLEPLLPRMLHRKSGQIAIVASLAGYRGLPTAAAYGASKAALINMAEALRVELDGSGVAIRLVCPGFIRTPLTDRNTFPMPFLMDVDDAARRLWQGIEFGKQFEITFPWQFALVMKCLRLLPYRLYFPLVEKGTR